MTVISIRMVSGQCRNCAGEGRSWPGTPSEADCPSCAGTGQVVPRLIALRHSRYRPVGERIIDREFPDRI